GREAMEAEVDHRVAGGQRGREFIAGVNARADGDFGIRRRAGNDGLAHAAAAAGDQEFQRFLKNSFRHGCVYCGFRGGANDGGLHLGGAHRAAARQRALASRSSSSKAREGPAVERLFSGWAGKSYTHAAASVTPCSSSKRNKVANCA